MTRRKLTVAETIVRFFPDYARSHRLRADVHRAAAAVLRCGTAACGAHVERCPCGHVHRIAYNSCRHRSCPRCGGARRANWLAETTADLLPCDHVHVIFTVPSELNVIWQYNRQLFANALFTASRQSLLQLLCDPKYLGARPGIISALHTWGRSLCIHPHVHCLVSAGGVTSSGEFIQQRRRTLLPARVLMAVFRGRFLRLLRTACDRGRLELPPSERHSKFCSLLNRLGRTAWNVRVQERCQDGAAVSGYLARYLSGGPIADRRLKSVTAKRVTFSYRDYRTNCERTQSLSPDEFLHRWFEHVPPRGLRTIRRCGLYANCHRQLRSSIRQQIASQPDARAVVALPRLDCPRCPRCNGPIEKLELSRPRRPVSPAKPRMPSVARGQPP